MPKTIANTTVDRLIHHAHLVLTASDSIRLTRSTAVKAVTPWAPSSGQPHWPPREDLLAATGHIP